MTTLRAFEAAARLRNFSAAAAELGLTQAAVSQQIRALETHLDVRLFRRLSRGVELTAEAAAYLPHLQSGFRIIAESTAELFGPKQARQVRIRSPISFASLWMAPRLQAFAQAFPDVLLDIATIHIPADYAPEERLDIRFGEGLFAGRRAIRLTSERLVPVTAPADGLASQDLWASRPLLVVSGARELWPRWFALAGQASPRPVLLRCDSFMVAYEAACAGAGILLGSRPLIDRALQAGRLHCLSPVELGGGAGHFLTLPDHGELTGVEQRVVEWWRREGGEAQA